MFINQFRIYGRIGLVTCLPLITDGMLIFKQNFIQIAANQDIKSQTSLNMIRPERTI